MVGSKVLIILLHIAAVFALPISDTTESDQVFVVTEVKSSEEGTEKPTTTVVNDAKNDSTIADDDGDKSLGSGDTSSGELSSEQPTELQPKTTTEASILVQPPGLPDVCFEPKIFYIRYEVRTRDENGNSIRVNRTKEIVTQDCCKGYGKTDTGRCEKTPCAGLKCGEDPDTKCVIIERCGKQLPVFFNKDGFVSEKCKQPEITEQNLCPNDICHANSTCPGYDDYSNRDAVCVGTGLTCDCSSNETWFLKDGKLAQCKH